MSPRFGKAFLINIIIAGVTLFFVNPLLGGFEKNDSEIETIKLIVGQSHIFSVSSPTRVIIGNPLVADVADVTSKEITVNAKGAGSTTLVYWDALGEQSAKIRVIIEDTEEFKRRIDALLKSLDLPGVRTEGAEDEAKILLLGTVKKESDRETIATALGKLKEKTVDLIEVKEEETAIEIDVQILELDRGATDTLGITWPGSVGFTEIGSAGIAAAGAHNFDKLFQILNVQRTTGTTAATANPFTLKVDALIEEGKARILSRPRIACQSGKEAELMVGGEKPIFTTSVQSTVGSSTSVEYKEYGIKLKVRPTITAEQRVKLGLYVQVSDIGDAETLGSSTAPTAKAYPIIKRTASTELFLEDGQTMAIGGLIKKKTEEDLRRVPWLSDVPILGAFFRQRVTKTGAGNLSRTDTELFITLTPTIVARKKVVAKEAEAKITAVRPNIIKAVEIDEEKLDPASRYSRIIQRRILERLTYPASAKASGFQGLVKLKLHLGFTGELLESGIGSSSGYKVLDDNALSTAKSITQYPPFPPAIESQDIWVEIPIEYKNE